MRLAKLTQLNSGTILYADLDMVGAWWRSASDDFTYVQLIGGAIAYVREMPDHITRLKQETKRNYNGTKNTDRRRKR